MNEENDGCLATGAGTYNKIFRVPSCRSWRRFLPGTLKVLSVFVSSIAMEPSFTMFHLFAPSSTIIESSHTTVACQ